MLRPLPTIEGYLESQKNPDFTKMDQNNNSHNFKHRVLNMINYNTVKAAYSDHFGKQRKWEH